jgi:hypothetical protein
VPNLNFPKQIWVNTALGANLRASPNTAAVRVGFAPQFTIGQSDQFSTDSTGTEWFRVTASNATGWVRGDLLVDHPVNYFAGSNYGLPGWSLLVPAPIYYPGQKNELAFPESNRTGEIEFHDPDRLYWWRLTVRTAAKAATLPADLGYYIVALHPELYDQNQTVGIGTYSATNWVVRASTDICRVSDIPVKWLWRGFSWPYVTVVEIVTRVRAYQFVFLTPDPDPPVVRQILDSIYIAQ